ncbi:MAG: thermonuclease family protein [Opitutaceae bacterium]|nr:thermonuclease family protein [Opitutaceae bacterium]
MGTLTIKGTIDMAQFWPSGHSDADTVKVSLAGIKTPFRFKADGAKEIKTTVFDTAVVRSKFGQTPVVEKGSVDVRLQGIDAPELHYKPQNYRQHHAESATVALGALLAKSGRSAVPCRVITRVEEPNDVCDMYARIVGDVVVRLGMKYVNLNEWLAAQGWAFPAFYTSMSPGEITRLTKLSESARKARKNIWRAGAYTAQIGPFDGTLRMRKKGSQIASETGPVIWPKFFRRLVEWKLVKTGAEPTLKAHLGGGGGERFVPTDELLEHSLTAAEQQRLADSLDANDAMTLAPKDYVIVEKPATLYAADGKTKISAW